MAAPQGPHVKITYGKDGSRGVAPSGYGGGLCQQATAPYEWRQGGKVETQRTPEADLPPVVAETVSERERHKA